MQVVNTENSVQKTSSIKRVHVSALDLLRGFAAVSVMLYHYTSDGGLVKFSSPFLNSLFFWGNMGVEVFFVISGFVIPYSIWGTSYKPQEFIRFLTKRIARIAPPAYICVLLILVQWIIVDYVIKAHQVNRIANITLSQIIGNVLFIYSFKDPRWLNGVFWTLSIEFQFYVIIGLFYNWLFDSRRTVAFMGIFLLLTAGYYIFDFTKHSFCAYAPLFAMGGLTFLYKKNQLSLWVYLALLLFFTEIAVNTLYPISAGFGIGASLIIAFINFKHPIFSFFGKISYSLYLVHLLVGGTAEFLLAKMFHPSTELGNIAVISTCIALAIAFAYAFHKLVEVPFMRLAKHLKL